MIEVLKDIGFIIKDSIPKKFNSCANFNNSKLLESVNENSNLLELEEFISKLGLCSDLPKVFPNNMQQFLGIGYQIWQYPHQLAKLMEFAKLNNVQSYLELGVYHGGTFVAMTSYLKKSLGRNISAVAVDIASNKPLETYIKQNGFEFKKMPSYSRRFVRFLKGKQFDMVLIDANHSFESVMNDFLILKNHARIMAFHDIVDANCPGVVKFWKWLKNSGDYHTIEYIDQYPEIELKNQKYLGIGVVTRK
ncbi:MAG: class I SAM-dependent methyltransferase [Flavobacteriales bacterium]|nr:class I SAM-dependent methyltransferase [Flavobacteriales bacterium]